MERSEYLRMAALEDTMWWYRGLHDALLARIERLGLAPGARILDAGCGTGGLLRRCREAFPDLQFFGIEFDFEAAALAAEKSRATVINGTVNSLPFPAGSIDAIVSADVLCHRAVDERAALLEFFRCLRPGGSLLLHAPAYEWLRSSHDRYVHDARRYTASALRARAAASGFKVARAGYWNSVLFPLMGAYRRTVGRARAASDVRAYPPWIDRPFYGVMRIERRLESAGLRIPFGGSTWLWAKKS